MKKLLSILLALVMVCTLCVIPSSAAAMYINKEKVNLPIGYSVTLKVSNADSVEWSTGDKSIAKIKSTKGNTAKIVGVGSGTTKITATVGNKSFTCKITVKKSFITAAKDEISVGVGKKTTVSVSVSGSKKIVYSNGGPEKCTVTSAKWDGDKLKITVKGKAKGKALIKIYAKGYSKTTMETITVNVTGKGSATVSSSTKTNESNLTEAEKVLELVNEKRKEAKVDALVLDEKLNKVAKLRAEEILKNLSHVRPDGRSCFTAYDDCGVKYVFAAENIAAGQSTAAEAVDNWMKSSGHRDNMLNKEAKKMGVALVTVPSGYTYYWVQVFSD